EIAQQQTTIDAAHASSRADAWKWAPTLSAFGNARAFNYAGFSGDKYSWAVGLELDWVLYDGGARDAQRHIADAQRVEAEAHLDRRRGRQRERHAGDQAQGRRSRLARGRARERVAAAGARAVRGRHSEAARRAASTGFRRRRRGRSRAGALRSITRRRATPP